MDKKLYLVAELDNNSQEQFRNLDTIIRQKGITGSQTKDIPYHITLAEFSIDKEAYLLGLLDTIKEEFFEINISYSSLGLFGLKVLFANPDMNMGLIKLYDFVKEHSLNKNSDLSAHTTLLIDEPENIIKILPELSKAFTKITGKLTNVSLYEFFPERFIKRITLSRDSRFCAQ